MGFLNVFIYKYSIYSIYLLMGKYISSFYVKTILTLTFIFSD